VPGWSSDAGLGARATVELGRAGHDVVLVGKRSAADRIMRRRRTRAWSASRRAPVEQVSPIGRARPEPHRRGGCRGPRSSTSTGARHWLAAIANRLSYARRPVVRTRHIVQPVRPHALNRWLYRSATDFVVTVTDAIRRQLLASGLGVDDRVVALPGGVDIERYRPAARPAHGLDRAPS
jgi:hypothetical protein